MVVAAGFIGLTAQEPTTPAVFSTAQAEAGKKAFQSTCGFCHTGSLLRRTGDPGELPPVESLPPAMRDVVLGAKGQVPPLAGSDFMARWGSRSTQALANRIREAVGGFRPEGAGPETYVDLTAFVLKSNGAKPGEKTLVPDAGTVSAAVTAR
jgi:hypothetical protein